MTNRIERAERDVPHLRSFCERLLILVTGLQREVKVRQDDLFAFMALVFLSKQVDHMRSILLLQGNFDVQLISRSMLEGMCQLIWASREPEQRAFQWRVFSYVEDWRELKEALVSGESIDPEKFEGLKHQLELHKDILLKKPQKKLLAQEKALSTDPYIRNWHGTNVREMCKNAEQAIGVQFPPSEALYVRLYGPLSGWNHWDPGPFRFAISRQPGRIQYSGASPEFAASTLAIGFQCVWQTAQVVDVHLHMTQEEELKALKDELVLWHAGSRSEQAPRG